MTKRTVNAAPEPVSTAQIALARLADLRDTIGAATGEDHDQLAGWEKMIKGHVLRQEWMEHPITKEIFDKLLTQVVAINQQLSTDEEMSDVRRRGIFREKQAYLWLTTLFSDTRDDTILESLISEIESRTETFKEYNSH